LIKKTKITPSAAIHPNEMNRVLYTLTPFITLCRANVTLFYPLLNDKKIIWSYLVQHFDVLKHALNIPFQFTCD